MQNKGYRIVLVVAALLILPGCRFLEAMLAATSPPEVAEVRVTMPTTPTPPPIEITRGAVLAELETTLVGLYDRVNPSVVSIQVVRQGTLLPDDDMFQFEFPREQYRRGSGSGFVWDQEGHLVTNYHVVENASRIVVQFHDGRTVDAELIGSDPDSDLAVLRVDVAAERLVPVRMGGSADVRVGQLVVALGNPFGLQNTMTVGFVSALGRSLPAESMARRGAVYSIPDVIQTDAPINPGNSGGVLLNDRGEVIGVTTAIISPVEASVGIGFAVPADIVMDVVPVLITEGRYTHAWIGISGTTLTADMASAMGLDTDTQGVQVIQVSPGSPAEAARLRGTRETVTVDGQSLPVGGDVIVAMDEWPVRSFEELVAALIRFRPDETVTLRVIRDGRQREVSLTLGERPYD